MCLIGACLPWKTIDAVTWILITMVTCSCKLGWKHCRADKPGIVYSGSTGGPPLQSILTFWVSSMQADGGSCAVVGSSCRDSHPSEGFRGRLVCAVQILRPFKGFSKPSSGQSAAEREMVANEVGALYESSNGLEWAYVRIVILLIFSVTLAPYFSASADGRKNANGQTKPWSHKML